MDVIKLRNQMSIKDPRILNYIGFVKKRAKDFDVQIKLSTKKAVDIDGVEVSGYFDGENKVLAVSCNKPEEQWFPILVHEACHMDQWIEQCDAWMNCEMEDGSDSTDELFEWFAGKEISDEEVEQLAMKSFEVELDCERRTLERIKEFNLPIDQTDYIQKANSYIYFYFAFPRRRSFYDSNRKPYEIEEVWKLMPKDFDHDYKANSERILSLFEEHGIL